tara:strand:- start:528 stop:1271 length:744 start_codon:yes stop_codon:yes gene_type:complete
MSYNTFEEYNILKTISIGDTKTGKSVFLDQVSNGGEYIDYYQPTIGVELYSETYTISENRKVKLHMWDTAGNSCYKNLIENYYINSQVVLVFFDMTRSITFSNSIGWIDNFIEKKYNSKFSTRKSIIILVGNKCETVENSIYEDRIKKLLKEKKIKIFFNISVKYNINIEELLNYIKNDCYYEFYNENINRYYENIFGSNDNMNTKLIKNKNKNKNKNKLCNDGLCNDKFYKNKLCKDNKCLQCILL